MRSEGGGFAAILRLRPQLFCAPLDKQATFSTAQDDETGRGPKVVCKSLVLRFPNHWHVSQLLNQVRSEGTAHKMRKRCGVLKYTVFTKDEKPVNLLNLQNLFNL